MQKSNRKIFFGENIPPEVSLSSLLSSGFVDTKLAPQKRCRYDTNSGGVEEKTRKLEIW